MPTTSRMRMSLVWQAGMKGLKRQSVILGFAHESMLAHGLEAHDRMRLTRIAAYRILKDTVRGINLADIMNSRLRQMVQEVEGFVSKGEETRSRMEARQMSMSVDAWDVSEYLDSEEAIAAYLNAVIEEDDPALLQAALGDVAKARGMTEIAKSAGVGRESLYKSLSASGNPSFQTIHKVLGSLGLKMELVPVEA